MSFLPPDWSCFVDGKLVGLNFATAFDAKRNGVAFVLKQIAAREGRIIRLAEEEQATRPKLQSYQERGQRVELFETEKSSLGPKGWTCMVDGELVGFGIRSRGKAWTNAFLYTMNRLGRRDSGAGKELDVESIIDSVLKGAQAFKKTAP